MLPIEPLLPEILHTLATHKRLVLQAAPGAGKTTRLPQAMLEADQVQGEIVVLEPRRIAARRAAARVAAELGEPLGRRVGYTIRNENVGGAEVRLRFVTEGVLTRRLVDDPTLRGVGAVLLDEFHERHVQGDLALALLKRSRQLRPELQVGVLSATLDTAPVSRFLDDAPLLCSEGRSYPVEVEHLEARDDRPLELQVVSAVRRLVREDLRGHVLVFLPGAREIRRAQEALASLAREHDLFVCPLHGDLPIEEQDRALSPASGRKIVLSTNVAESSITLDGVVAVIDSGLVRRARHDGWRGFASLELGRCAKASAIQRAGRAGRTAPGRALRLYTALDFASRPEHEVPEMLRTDLAPVLLDLAVAKAADLPLLDMPDAAAWQSARSLLQTLDLLDADAQATALGRQAARLPVAPRVARFVLEAARRGVAEEACATAAVLSERDPRQGLRQHPGQGRRDGAAEDSDLDAVLDLLDEARHSRFSAGALRAMQLDAPAVQRIERARKALWQQLGRQQGPTPSDAREALLLSLLTGFADRVAKRKSQGSKELTLCSGGGSAVLADSSLVHHAPFLLALAIEGPLAADAAGRAELGHARSTGGKPVVRLACRIEPEALLEVFPERVVDRRRAWFDEGKQRVFSRTELVYEELVLDEAAAEPGPEAHALLAEAALARGAHTFAEGDALERWCARAAVAARRSKEVIAPDAAAIEAALRSLAAHTTSLAELRELGLLHTVMEQTPGRALVEKLAPERLTLPSGRVARIEYEPGKDPWIESYLQDFCGWNRAPEVGGEPLTLHLLAPNRRAVQVTRDLANFWVTHYPPLRKTLMRRYPRHAWPEDPSVPVPAKRR